MKLSEWARQKGVTYKTAWRLWKSGKFPEPTEQLATGTIIVLRESIPEVPVRIYARVSSNDQRPDLERQVSRLASYAAERRARTARGGSHQRSRFRTERAQKRTSFSTREPSAYPGGA